MNYPMELFNELESYNIHDQEKAKQKIWEAFSSTKESWIVNGMIDYYAQTDSFRIVEVLVKTQTPHDIHIFNKLQKCLQESNPKQKHVALTLFTHIVRKHPTWLYKVVNHGFLKDLLRYLRFEHSVIALISGLLCIISLLPIIPTSISVFLPDLFEIFNNVAILTCQQLNLSECHLAHLQYGLYLLFNRLYGMYPCNFMDYIRNEYIAKPEKTPIFNHTIRGLLDTVKIHPNLITSTKSSEIATSRFKKMEPHDVVIECGKYSVDNEKSVSSASTVGFLDCSHMKPLEYTHTVVDPLPALPARNYLASAKSVENKFESLWSPSLVIQATPPPTANLPNTPTPTPNFLMTKNAQAFSDAEESTKLVEPGVEATPETTPIKPEIRNTFKPYPNSSQTARNIWPKSSSSAIMASTRNQSTPSSPMKKDSNIKYPTANLQPFDFSSNQKFMRLLSDREHHVADPMMISKEDQEVNDINSMSNNNSDLDSINPTMMDFDESTDTDEADTTPPLYPKVDYVRRVKRLRLYSHCICSAGTSPADSINYMPRIPRSFRMKRYNSWPNLKSSDVIIKSSKLNKQNDSDHQQSSSDEAVSAVSHFKNKTIQNGDTKMRNGSIFKKIKEDLKLKPLEVVQKATTATQTIEHWPSAYENMFYNIFEKEMKGKPDETITVTQTMTTTVSKSYQETSSSGFMASSASPNEMIDQYIQTSLKRKNSNDYRDQIELLAIQLQFEKHQRETHAERNRRLLGKSRQLRGLEQSNGTLSHQVLRLTEEIDELNKKSMETKNIYQLNMKKLEERINFLSKKCAEENERQKQLQREKDSLQVHLDDEMVQKKQLLLNIDQLSAENFDLKHLYEDAKAEAERGKQYRDQLKKLESDLILFNEARLKCQQQMEELSALKARDIEMDYIVESYKHEMQDMKRIADYKTSQIDGLNRRLCDYEQQIQKKDVTLADQKRFIKSIKDVYEEKFKALEDKYATQKAILLKMEENALELSRNQQAIISPESERTDLLGHTSPLSISLASSNELSVSLRSELRSLIHSEPVQQPTLQRQQSIHDDMPVASSSSSSAVQPITYKKKS